MTALKTSKIKSIRKGSVKHVYDIGVEKNHNFFANGFLVSNCFQEQFMLLSMELAGFSEGEADKMRKTLVKKSLDTADKKGGERAQLRERFVTGAKELHGLDEKKMHELFDKIEFFSLYGFNKSLYFAEEVNTYFEDGTFNTKKKMSEVSRGDLLLTRDESTGKDTLTRVVDRHDHGVLDLVEVELTSGEKVKCTWDHKFRTVETGEMLPLWKIHKLGLSVVVNADESLKKKTRISGSTS